MSLQLSGYTEPGTYIGEVIVPNAVSVATSPDVLAIVAPGNHKKRTSNEAVKRGQVFEEALTVAGSAPYLATLVNRGDRRITNTTVRRTLSGHVVSLPATAFSYPAAFLLGTAAGPFDLSSNQAIGFKMDGGQEITIELRYDAAPAVPVVSGTLIVVEYTFAGVAGNAATRTQIAAAINIGLAAATTLGYGAAYAAVVTDVTTGIKFTSPVTTWQSDVQILQPFANNAATLFGFTAPARAVTKIEINALYYDAAATYEADYVSTNTTLDPVADTATRLIRIGSFANVTSFVTPVDYALLSGDIDWSPDVAATLLGSVSETYNLTTNYNIRLAFDGHAAVSINLVSLASPPPGYAVPAVPAAVTAAEIVKNINAVIAVSTGYGPSYRAVASVSTTKVALTSPVQGTGSSIEISAPTTLDATLAIFGIAASQLPYTVLGTGNKPNVGAIYFATYEFDRPTTDYNIGKRFYSKDAMIQDLTPVSTSNVLAQYAEIAFENGAPSVVCCQVNDLIPGLPTVNEVKSAIDGLANSTITTDVLVVDTRVTIQTYLMTHVEQQSSPTGKNYRVGWFGMPLNTLVGDKDTPDTFVYRAAITLQTAPDSPARGRFNLVAPGDVSRTITLEDGSSVDLEMDSTAVACAVAAVQTSFSSPSLSLASKTIIGFDAETFPSFVRAERAMLADNGTLLVVNNGGRLEVLDPVTTELGGGRLPQFSYRSCMSQRDNVSRIVERNVDRNLRGVVPDDLADFIFDIKILVSSSLTALIESRAIGPYRDASGASREIDLVKDVQAEQSRSDPTKFFFRYFYFLKYPALRFFGEFSVDASFFG